MLTIHLGNVGVRGHKEDLSATQLARVVILAHQLVVLQVVLGTAQEFWVCAVGHDGQIAILRGLACTGY